MYVYTSVSATERKKKEKKSMMSQAKFESYPPLFQQRDIGGGDRRHGVEYSTKPLFQEPETETEIDPVPLIDFQCITREKLSEACKDWGIFRLVNHGIPPSLLNQIHRQTKQMFDLSFESKQALFTTPLTYFWGTPALTPAGLALHRPPPTNINWVEGFNVPLSQLPLLQPQDPMLVSFRVVLEEYGRHLSRVATTVFEAAAENLKLDPNKKDCYLSPPTGLLRVYRYPSCPEGVQAWGMDVHTDSSVLSILNQDQVGGLQVYKDKDNKWLDVQPIPRTLIVNLGDMMQAVSSDEYRSVKHRVKVSTRKERISIGYFVFPAEDCVIENSKYKAFTYDDFRAQVQQDVKTKGFKVGLQRFKLTHQSS